MMIEQSSAVVNEYSLGYAQAKKEELLHHVGQPISSLPTPACILNRSKVKRNCDAMLENVQRMGVSFRAHIKTHKTLEGVRLQLASAGHGKIIVSTIQEAYAVLPLVQEGLVTDILYGVPTAPSKIAALHELKRHVPHLRLMIDSEDQIDALHRFNLDSAKVEKSKWSLFIKVDCGYGRAGLAPTSDAFQALTRRVLTDGMAEDFEIYGFYTHAGQSYHDEGCESAMHTLQTEIETVNTSASFAQDILKKDDNDLFVLSVGATPTAHAFKSIQNAALPQIRGKLEIHAGNYGFCDLQQLATGLVEYEDVAIRVLTQVGSRYHDRHEVLIDAGGLALSKDTGPIKGYGNIDTPYKDWCVGRVSQEHGILTSDSTQAELPAYGQKLLILPQHACLTGACYQWYYVVDEDGIDATVKDIWLRFAGW